MSFYAILRSYLVLKHVLYAIGTCLETPLLPTTRKFYIIGARLSFFIKYIFCGHFLWTKEKRGKKKNFLFKTYSGYDVIMLTCFSYSVILSDGLLLVWEVLAVLNVSRVIYLLSYRLLRSHRVFSIWILLSLLLQVTKGNERMILLQTHTWKTIACLQLWD